MTEPEIMAWLGIPVSSGLRLREGLRERVLEKLDGWAVPHDDESEVAVFTAFLRAAGPARGKRDFYSTRCAHCGQECRTPERGYAAVPGPGGMNVPVCHPSDPLMPDCYRRITVYHEPLGTLISPFALPRGIEGIRMTEPLPEG